ncbi:DNA methyltransferase Dim-2 [Verticillium alfalfae VaMs.102]|uniref:DNA (cytosine-5-)-methyltransferase n=1 Tax=Verticillium alfalfae (strain VaMs.102 / ATCC MYA-4576 / FGSC 10136) TaxID=526221 RepID=C9SGE9_VERA1|nr:DNA methyltransferase Dim-2 [Verticillium alfalfae VaMs.102]EEY17489.1 DNA methyltransferase Dim-2 [Verticillium alfalfae VaMs.102]
MPYFIYDDVDTSADDSSSTHSREVSGILNPEDAYAGDTEDIIEDGYWPEIDDEWLPDGKRSSTPQGRDDDAVTLQPCDLLPWENDEIGLVQDERGNTLGRLLSPSVDTLAKSRGFTVTIPESTLVHPVSSFPGFCAPAPERKEKSAVEALLKNAASPSSDDFFEIELGQFVVYRHSLSDRNKPPHQRQYPYEMRPLQTLCTKDAHSTLYADGILSCGDAKFFVRGIAFGDLPLGNYGMAKPTVGDRIWISSTLNQRIGKKNIYYKLTTPAKEYARYYHGFLWIADLAKHVVDYMAVAGDKKRRVEFRHFKSHFHRWLIQAHGRNAVFNRWLNQYGRTDFRVAVNAYSDFIYKEAHGVLTSQQVFFHTFWKEIKTYTAYKPYGLVHNDASGRVSAGQSPEAEESRSGRFDGASPLPGSNPRAQDGKRSSTPPLTVVTPYIYDCFAHMPFGHLLEEVNLSQQTEKLRTALIEQQHLQPGNHMLHSARHLDTTKVVRAKGLQRAVCVGDVISTPRDEGLDSKWKREVAAGFDDVDRWLGLVQRIHVSKAGTRSFDVIWIYRPVDTICGQMKYPWDNELFLSDHCSCYDKHDKIEEGEVLEIHTIQWGGSPTSAVLFCRQTYLHEEHRWITLKEEHKTCSHRAPRVVDPDNYRVGETVLALLDPSGKRLEPCELVTAPRKPGVKIQLRKLLRRIEVDPYSQARPNELVYSDEMYSVLLAAVYGRCLVRYYGPGEAVQTPYDRDGVGNAFYISTYLQNTSGTKTCEPFSRERPFPKTFRQGMDPSEGFTKLEGFDLFCGGGNFGRGLEESGAIEMRWANDINMRAVHTYMANLDDPSRVSPFAGSIDDLTTPNQRKNQSLVAAFASFIDIYRPKYGLLENVVEMIQGRKTREEDVFCQLICAIVGMGYQTHFFLLDAWTFGSPQSRSRIFFAFAAPGLRLPEVPMQSHLPLAMRSRSLGLLSNGEPMLRKTFMPTAFASVTARQALTDLPDIADAKADCCIPFPDHRQSIGVTRLLRPQLSCMPTRPWGLNLSTAYNKGHGPITAAEMSLYPQAKRQGPSSKAFGRLHPDKLMGTITTTPSPSDGYGRAVLHWEQNRILTVMEARRAQGFRDHEVILGTPAEQWKTVGNSVAREVSIALGLSFRAAWLGSLIKGDEHLPLPRHIVRQPRMRGVEVEQAKTQRQQPQADAETTLVRRKRGDTPDTPLLPPVVERSTVTDVSHSYPTPGKHGAMRRVITPRRTSSRRSSPTVAHGMTAYDPHDESIFGSETVLPIRKPRGNNERATDWRGRRAVDETYAPSSDYESERTTTTSQDPEVWTPEPSRDLSTTPATSVEGDPRVDSAASARTRPANSVIFKLFASKRKTAGEDKREAKRTCLP